MIGNVPGCQVAGLLVTDAAGVGWGAVIFGEWVSPAPPQQHRGEEHEQGWQEDPADQLAPHTDILPLPFRIAGESAGAKRSNKRHGRDNRRSVVRRRRGCHRHSAARSGPHAWRSGWASRVACSRFRREPTTRSTATGWD
jgi:hypothetical protein